MQVTPDDNKRIRELTEQIQTENDREKFISLVRELNQLLDAASADPQGSKPNLR